MSQESVLLQAQMALGPFKRKADQIHPDWAGERRASSLTESGPPIRVKDYRRAQSAYAAIVEARGPTPQQAAGLEALSKVPLRSFADHAGQAGRVSIGYREPSAVNASPPTWPAPSVALPESIRVNPVAFTAYEVAELERSPDVLNFVANLNDLWASSAHDWLRHPQAVDHAARAKLLRAEADRRTP